MNDKKNAWNLVSRIDRRTAGCVFGWLAALIALASSGCAGGPFADCEDCVTHCETPVDCFGYFPTCWRPWPCPQDPCYDWKGGMPAEMVPEAILSEGVLPEAAAPAAFFPAAALPGALAPPAPPHAPRPTSGFRETESLDTSGGYHDSVDGYPPTPPDVISISGHETAQFRPLPAVTEEPAMLAVQPRHPAPISSTQSTPEAHTPFPSRALRTVNFIEQ